MTLEEKVKFLIETKKKKYFYISPKKIESDVTLIDSNEQLEAYEQIEEKTLEFAQELIVNLIAEANYNGKDGKEKRSFYLIFCQDSDEQSTSKAKFNDLINYREKIIAVPSGGGRGNDIFLDFAKLMQLIERFGIKYSINENSYSSYYSSGKVNTEFEFSYSFNKELDNKEGRQLKKTRKKV